VLRGEVPERVEYSEGLVRVSADVQAGQKTGAFLDQRENHHLAATYARGEALDCFSYLGGFALQLATRATRVTAVEISEQACAALRRNVERNGFQNVEVVTANAFDYLRDAVDEGRRFDTIVLDPPSFAKNKDAIESAVRGYKEINLRALQLLAPGGILLTASCTYHVDEERFEGCWRPRPRTLDGECRSSSAGAPPGTIRCSPLCARRGTSSSTCCGWWTDAPGGVIDRAERPGRGGPVRSWMMAVWLLGIAGAGCGTPCETPAPLSCCLGGCNGDSTVPAICGPGGWTCPAGSVPPGQCPLGQLFCGGGVPDGGSP
jgi:16S rRNA G966 N2-methylase RsmD